MRYNKVMTYFADLLAVETALKPYWPSNLTGRQAYTTEYMQSFMDFLGNPQNKTPAVHIAGTSGKTSTAYYAAALLQAAGFRTGLLISPHIERISERVQVGLSPLADRQFCDEFAVFMDLAAKSKLNLTYAELLYGFGYWEFARQGVDFMVIETGMGGLLDATNVIGQPGKTCIITDIGFDHTNVLGSSLTDIAAHKAGIIGVQSAVFCHRQAPEVMKVIEAASKQKQADLHVITRASDEPAFLPLFQRRNFGLAAETVDFMLARNHQEPLSRQAKQLAAKVHIPARMEIRYVGQKMVILDSAHNPQKMQSLQRSIAARFPDKKLAALVAFSKSGGRDVKDLLKELRPLTSHCIATQPPPENTHGWHEPTEIARAARAAGIRSAEAIADYRSAFDALIQQPEALLLATGSLYLHQYIRPLTTPAPTLP